MTIFCLDMFKRKSNNNSNEFGDKKANKRALLVGINYRGTSGELRGCINDIKNVREMLLKNGYKDENIRMMSEDHKELPTKHKIAMGLIWLMKNEKNKPMDLFFHYSGHGSWIYDKNGDEMDGRDECLVPIDYKRNGMLYDDDIKALIDDHLTSKSNLFSIIDACHSSSMFDLRFNLSCDKIDTSESNVDYQFKVEAHTYDMKIKGNVVTLSGCEDLQTSADAYIQNRFQGALTFAFLDTMRKYNNKLTYEELMKGIYSVLKGDDFYEQRPTIASNRTIILEDNVHL